MKLPKSAAAAAFLCLFAARVLSQVPMTIALQGSLRDGAGAPKADGTYSMKVSLYSVATGGTALWSETLSVTTSNGLFQATLGSTTPLSSLPFDAPYWAGIQVEADPEMTPRLPLSSVPYSLKTGGLSLPLEATVTSPAGGAGLRITDNGAGAAIKVLSTDTNNHGTGIFASSAGGAGISAETSWPNAAGVVGHNRSETGTSSGVAGFATSPTGSAVYGNNFGTGSSGSLGDAKYGVKGTSSGAEPNAAGVFGSANTAPGVMGTSSGGAGVYGTTYNGTSAVVGYVNDTGQRGVEGFADNLASNGSGVYGNSASITGYGGYFNNSSGDGVALLAEGSGGTRTKPALRVNNTETVHGMAAYVTNSSDYATAHFFNAGTGETLYVQGGSGATTGNALILVDQAFNTKFRITKAGEVYADGAFHPGGADFAEMLPATPGLEPGDVLAIGPDGQLTKSAEAYQTSVAGVHATKPGIVAGTPMDGNTAGKAPLAVVGVVPVKVTAQNGPIRPGDLLTPSGVSGHAMKGTDRARMLGAVIGKALQPFEGPGEGTIQALVNLK